MTTPVGPPAQTRTGTPLLAIDDLRSGYGFLEVLHGVSLRIGNGSFVGIIGPNGAGKSTLLKTIAGLVTSTTGRVMFDGVAVQRTATHELKRIGLALVSEGLNLFSGMTVEENLTLGAYGKLARATRQDRLDHVNSVFPRLAERRDQQAGTLSGGERKMLAVGRALMGAPRLLLVDEPSLGLAPKTTDILFEALHALNRDGLSIAVVEQNVPRTIEVSEYIYVLEQGAIALEGRSVDLAHDPNVQAAYFGVSA
jgi:branched-chain amino acid transport system ATP-binding protein